MDSLSRSEYADKILSSISPAEAVTLLGDRLQYARKANEELANWIEERYRIELEYATALAKLSSRNISADVQEAGLGSFAAVWGKVAESTNTLAGASQSFANKLQAEIIHTLKRHASLDGGDREWSEMRMIQTNLATLADDVASAEEKVEKYKRKGSSKIASAHAGVNEIVAEWDSQAPLVFEKLQGLDETRLMMLKDTLTRYQTSEVDKAQRIVSICEGNLNELLSFDPADEIKMYAVQVQTNGLPHRSTRQTSLALVGTHGAGTGSRAAPPPPPHGHGRPSSQQLQQAAARTSSLNALSSPSSSKRRSSVATEDSVTPATPGKSRFNRMSTILRKSETGGRRLFGSSKDKKNKHHMEQIDVRESAETSSLASNRSSQYASFSGPTGRNTTSGAVPVAPAQVVPPAAMTQTPSYSSSVFNSGMNGHGDDPDAINIIGTSQAQQQQPQPTVTSIPTPAEPAVAVRESEVDDEGYSIPPPVAKGSAVAEMDETYGELQQETGHALAIDIQSTPLKDEQDEEQAARERVASSLRMKPTVAASRSMRGRRGENAASKLYPGGVPSLAGDVPALPVGLTKIMNNGHGVPPPPPPASHRGSLETTRVEEKAQSPVEKSLPPISPTEEDEFHNALEERVPTLPVAEDESAPLTGTAVTTEKEISTPVVDDEGDEDEDDEEVETAEEEEEAVETAEPVIPILPDLTSSIVETVNVSLHGGEPSRVLIVGDIALSYSGSATKPVPLRLMGTETLDRVHPSAQVITSVEDDDDEEDGYVLHPDRLSSVPTITFKYSVTNADYVPIIVKPSWKFEPHQTSVIIRYVLNPSYPAEELVLSDMSLVVSIEGAPATAAQSKPPGVFNREAGHLAIVLTSAETPEIRLRKGVEGNALVRFWTDGQAKEGNGGRGGVSLAFRYAPEDSASGLLVEIKDAVDQKESDPFADESEGEWAAVPAIRSIVSGMYFASE
ncbi:Muniscin C-terminal mu homology domain-containing protein [Myxozyma melibiosi]|uniref:Muniscin C-terminal mu homology domain-containing protein n=1 Tax=Myxozyma melibiosi TaxID=54550 RepID=A0ABR1F9S2_9ASCO